MLASTTLELCGRSDEAILVGIRPAVRAMLVEGRLLRAPMLPPPPLCTTAQAAAATPAPPVQQRAGTSWPTAAKVGMGAAAVLGGAGAVLAVGPAVLLTAGGIWLLAIRDGRFVNRLPGSGNSKSLAVWGTPLGLGALAGVLVPPLVGTAAAAVATAVVSGFQLPRAAPEAAGSVP